MDNNNHKSNFINVTGDNLPVSQAEQNIYNGVDDSSSYISDFPVTNDNTSYADSNDYQNYVFSNENVVPASSTSQLYQPTITSYAPHAQHVGHANEQIL